MLRSWCVQIDQSSVIMNHFQLEQHTTWWCGIRDSWRSHYAVQSQKAVNAYFSRKQLPPFVYEDQHYIFFVMYTWSKKKWNESGFRPPLCTYRLNWARRTSWGWWDDWDDTVLQTQDSKFKPWRSEAEHATSRSRRLPTILTFTRGWGRNIFSFFQTAKTGNRTPDSGVKGSGANHYPRAPTWQRYTWSISATVCFYVEYSDVTAFLSVSTCIPRRPT